MTAQIFTSIVVNSLFLAFLATFYDLKCDGLKRPSGELRFSSGRLPSC